MDYLRFHDGHRGGVTAPVYATLDGMYAWADGKPVLWRSGAVSLLGARRSQLIRYSRLHRVPSDMYEAYELGGNVPSWEGSTDSVTGMLLSRTPYSSIHAFSCESHVGWSATNWGNAANIVFDRPIEELSKNEAITEALAQLESCQDVRDDLIYSLYNVAVVAFLRDKRKVSVFMSTPPHTEFYLAPAGIVEDHIDRTFKVCARKTYIIDKHLISGRTVVGKLKELSKIICEIAIDRKYGDYESF